MAQVLTDDDELDLEDEQRKKQQQDTIGKPIAYGPMPKGEVPPSTTPTNQPAPEIGAASSSAQTVSGAAPYNPQPPAPRPESQAFTDWQAQDLAKHPAGQSRYHGLARVADTIAQMTWPGQAAEIGGEFGTLGAKAKANRLAGGAAQENTQIGYGEHERQANALEQEQEAKAKNEETGGQLQTMPSGVQVMTKNVAPIVAADVRGQSSKDVQGMKNEGATDLQSQKESSPLEQAKTGLANAQADLAKFRANPNSPMYRIAQEHLRIAQGDYAMKLKEFGFNYEPSTLTPEEQNTLPTDQDGNVVSLHSPLKPTSQSVNAAQRAQNVVTQVPRINAEIQELQSSIGPIPGRWNQFWQGDVGAADPKFAHLADDMEYLSSAVALAHAYGRLPSSISEKFDRMYQAGKQDPQNMLAAMQVAMEWMPKIAQGGQTLGEKGGAANPTTPHTGPVRFKDFTAGGH